MSRRKRFRVGRASTGLGLFATAPFRRGDFIAEYTGPRISTEEADRREARGARYMYEIDSRWTVDGSRRSNIARYANHSCRPNAESDVVRGKVFLRAIKAIEPGSEITYDYGREYFDLIIKPMGCRCPHCSRKRARVRPARSAGRKRPRANGAG
jgi:SET domain-containing protein